MHLETQKPWGKEVLIHQGNDYAVKEITLKQSMSTSLHFHNIKHETIMVFRGDLSVLIGQDESSLEKIVLSPGGTLSVPPKTVHKMFAERGDCIYFEAQSDHLEDVVRLADGYGRAS